MARLLGKKGPRVVGRDGRLGISLKREGARAETPKLSVPRPMPAEDVDLLFLCSIAEEPDDCT